MVGTKTLANICSSGSLSVLVSVNTVLLEVLCEFVYSGDITYPCIVPAGQFARLACFWQQCKFKVKINLVTCINLCLC